MWHGWHPFRVQKVAEKEAGGVPSDSAPRVRVLLTAAQVRSRIRMLAYGAAVGVLVATVLVVAAVRSEGGAAWLALVAAVLPLTVAILATRAAFVLRRLRPPPPPTTPRRKRIPTGGRLPVNLGRAVADPAADPTSEVRSTPPDPV